MTGGPMPEKIRRRRWLLWAAIALLLFGAYLLGGFYFAPQLIRSQATQWVKTNLNKSIAIGEIKVNPLSFKVDISDIAIPEPARPMVAVGHVRLGFALLSLFQDAWGLNELRLDRPFVQATIRPDGSLNLLELVPPSHPDSVSPAFRIDVLSVNQGRIAFADFSRAQKPEETLSPITFTLKDFYTKKNEGGEFSLDAKSARNESFSWRGTISMAPIASQGRFALANLRIDTIGKFLGDRLPVALTGGRLAVNGAYGFGYGKNGISLNMAVPKLTLSDLDFDGRDTLFHGAVHVDEAAANVSRFNFTSDAKAPRPFGGAMPRLQLHGVSVAGSGPAKGAEIKLADATLDDAKFDYAGRRIELGALSLGGLDMHLAREKTGALSVMALLPAPTGAVPTPAAAPWNVTLANFALADLALHFEDRAVAPTVRFDFAPIAVTASGLGTDLTKPVNVQLSAGINAKGKFIGQGVVTPSTKAADLQLSLTGLPLTAAVPYMPPYPALDLRSGDLGISGALNLSGGEHSQMRFKGAASIDNFGLYERASKGVLLAWRGFRLSGIDYQPGKVDIAAARLIRPTGRVAILADRSFNFTALMAQPGSAPAPAKPASPALAFRLKTLDIDGGTMSFADYSIDPNFQAQIEALQGGIKNIGSAPDAVAVIDLKGQVIDHFSPVTITGTANLLGYDRNTNIQLAFRNIELPIFNPYSGRYAGYAIAKGKLTTELNYKIVNRALQAEHHVIIDQLEWGNASESKERVPWPVGLLTSLLKDKNGVIDLNLPVRGSLDDPTFRLGPVIWQIIGNLVEKIVTAPFSLIGSLFAGADKAQYIDFAPGSAALPANSADSLAALAKGLGERPGIQLDIPAAPGLKEDAVFIADARIDALLMAKEIKKGQPADPAALSPDDQHDRLQDLYKIKFGKSPAFPDVLADAAPPADAKPRAAGQPPPDEKSQRLVNEVSWMRGELRKAFAPAAPELATLGSTRATAVRDALLAKGDIDPARVFLVTGQAGTPMGNFVRLELKLR